MKKIKKGIIQFKYNYSDDEYRSIHVGRKGRPSKLPKNLKMLYDTPHIFDFIFQSRIIFKEFQSIKNQILNKYFISSNL